MMAQACTICTHADRHAIEESVIDGQPKRRIAARFGVKETSLRRHCSEHLPRVLAENVSISIEPTQPAQIPTGAPVQVYAARAHDRQQRHEFSLTDRLARLMGTLDLLMEACDRWLRDADDPSQYDIGPRAHDVTVTYEECVDQESGKTVRRKARLSELLGRLEGAQWIVGHVETKHADPRELAVKLLAEGRGQTQTLMDVMKEHHSIQEVEAFQQEVLSAIGEVAPDVRARIEQNLHRRRTLRRPLGAMAG